MQEQWRPQQLQDVGGKPGTGQRSEPSDKQLITMEIDDGLNEREREREQSSIYILDVKCLLYDYCTSVEIRDTTVHVLACLYEHTCPQFH